jgi:hypothetical protein
MIIIGVDYHFRFARHSELEPGLLPNIGLSMLICLAATGQGVFTLLANLFGFSAASHVRLRIGAGETSQAVVANQYTRLLYDFVTAS